MPAGALLAKMKNRRKYTKGRTQTIKQEAPLPEFENTEIYQELTKERNYFKDTSDEKLCIDIFLDLRPE